MLRYLVVLLFSGVSMACGFAGLGLALYAHGPALAAAMLFGAVGFATGLGCAVLQTAFVGRPAPQPAALPADELAALVRATLASVAQERSDRSSRPGSAADRRPAAMQPPTPAPAASTTPAPQRVPAEQARFVSSVFGA